MTDVVSRVLIAWLVVSVVLTPAVGVIVHGGRRHPTPQQREPTP